MGKGGARQQADRALAVPVEPASGLAPRMRSASVTQSSHGEVELKPCPFCGSTEINKTDNGHEEWLQCENCGAGGPWIEPPDGHYFTGNELADQWNTRALEQSDAEREQPHE
jgi:Lar family restriction alleviation protein